MHKYWFQFYDNNRPIKKVSVRADSEEQAKIKAENYRKKHYIIYDKSEFLYQEF